MTVSRHQQSPRSSPFHAAVSGVLLRARGAAPFLAMALVASACGKSEAVDTAPESAAVIVLGPRDVATVSMQTLTDGITITGSLDPAERVDVKSQIAGQIDRVAVDRGTAVRRGQLLATIDARGAGAQASSAEASLASAERDLRAADTLYRAGAVSERDYMQAKVARDAAQAQLTQAQENVGRTTVASPIAGVVSDKAIERGEAVQTAALLFTIVNTESLELAGRVAPGAIADVRTGQAVQLTLDAYTGRKIMGRVARIDPVAESGTRQVAVYVHVPNANQELVAGLFATGRILTRSGTTPFPTVPSTAVRTIGGESVLYAIEDSRIVRRVVVVGARDDERGLVEVRSGVREGEQVLVNAPETMAAGAPVRMLGDSAVASPVSAVRTPGGE